MAFFLLFRFCLLSLTHSAAGLQSPDPLGMIATLGNSITLPCGIPSITSCSSVIWSRFDPVTELVKAEQVTDPYVRRLRLQKDCSLQISLMELPDAQLYSCKSGALSSNASLRILQISENSNSAADKIELHCYLNTHQGYKPCNTRGMNITWSTEDNTPLNGNRFRSENISACFGKLIIRYKLTDHHRKWRCQLSLNGTVKANVSYATTVKGTKCNLEVLLNYNFKSGCTSPKCNPLPFTLDGVEEVFAAVGESVSLSCGNTSSLSEGSRLVWRMGSQPVTAMSPDKKQTEASRENEISSHGIMNVSPLHAGEYQCLAGGQVLNKIWLYTLDVFSESSPGGRNVTLTCVLKCSKECGKDLNLTWSGNVSNSLQSGFMDTKNNTLIKRIDVPFLSMASDELTCSVHREGELMASKRWHTVNSLSTAAWLILPIGLLGLISAGVLYVYVKRKHNKDAENELTSIGMTHVYEDIEDDSNEEQPPKRRPKREAATTTDSFYDLLQAVN
ncbi:uncharacterized protein [Labrus bergylta]|uniref:uncharacterized protein isoform X1 n=1 Tax=Labrus bergylta TaxID=56723 RepID=UPI003313EA63